MMVMGTTERSAGYFSAAALMIPIIFLPNFNTRKHLQKFLTLNRKKEEKSFKKQTYTPPIIISLGGVVISGVVKGRMVNVSFHPK